MDEEKEYVHKMSELDKKMYNAVGHYVNIKLKSGKELKHEWVGCYESATDADMDYPVIYIMNDEGSGLGYTEDEIETLEIAD